jgi:uncharacterized protein YukE
MSNNPKKTEVNTITLKKAISTSNEEIVNLRNTHSNIQEILFNQLSTFWQDKASAIFEVKLLAMHDDLSTCLTMLEYMNDQALKIVTDYENSDSEVQSIIKNMGN